MSRWGEAEWGRFAQERGEAAVCTFTFLKG